MIQLIVLSTNGGICPMAGDKKMAFYALPKMPSMKNFQGGGLGARHLRDGRRVIRDY